MNLDPHQDQSMRVELDDDVTAGGICGVVTGIDPDKRTVSVWDRQRTYEIAVGDIETINQQGTWPRAGKFDPPPGLGVRPLVVWSPEEIAARYPKNTRGG